MSCCHVGISASAIDAAPTSPPRRLLAAVEQLTWAEVPVLRVLMRIRSAGRLSLGRRRPILDGMLALGFVVLDRSGDELVLAALGRPWTRRGGGRAPRLAEQSDPARFFVEFTEPGWAKMVANFRMSGGS
jgi:hypothetical protein